MRDLGFYGSLSRFRFLSYRLKIMVMAFIGTHIPLIAIACYFAARSSDDKRTMFVTLGVTLVATLLGTAITLFVLDRLLRPVLATSESLKAYRESRVPCTLPTDFTDDVGTLMADTRHTIEHLDAALVSLEFVDEGTKLPNRKRFLQNVSTRAIHQSRFAVVLVRLSNYSRIAETMDRIQAETAMNTIAKRLESAPLGGEKLARVSASEFAFLLEMPSRENSGWLETAGAVNMMLKRCSSDIKLFGIEVAPLLHAGLAAYPDDAQSASQLLDRATASVAQAGDAAPVIVHSADARIASLERFRVEQELRHAIDNNEFELHFQPVIDAIGRRTVAAEALIRWNHPTRGLLPPAAFIPVAEASGLSAPIGLWVLRDACAKLRRWQNLGRSDVSVCVNLSAEQFLDPALQEHVIEAIDEHGVSPDRLELELTETAVMVDTAHTSRVFKSLRDMGVGIAIDDFGTGYASMSRLRQLTFDKVKIDREFVTDVFRLKPAQAICRALIELSRGLALTVVAEGVEQEEEVRFLLESGCGLFQGYYFARPMPLADFEATLPFTHGSSRETPLRVRTVPEKKFARSA